MRLADVADVVSTAHFRSEALRTTHKDDGTPVSQIDLATEQAMFDLVRAECPDDHVVGEEIGTTPGTSRRRWIFDGIDGTLNYADGRPGWATMITLEVDGVVTVGVVSAPLVGRRWWAERNAGAWSGPYHADGSFNADDGVRLNCGDRATLDRASVIVIPHEGYLDGWRNDLHSRFVPPAHPRSRCFALDAALVASGELDVAILTLPCLWDLAGTSLLVSEAGGVYRDAWGGTRFDTSTGVFTNQALIGQVLEVLSEFRPPTPDEPVVTRLVTTALLGEAADESWAIDDEWRTFGLRAFPSMSARVHVDNAPAFVLDIVDERAAFLPQPLVGVTTDGVARPFRTLQVGGGHGGRGGDTRPIADAALAFLQALSAEQRQRTMFEMDAPEWRMWINVHMNHFRHGVMLEDLAPPVRELGLDLLRATLSARGFHQARTIMHLNELLAELTGDYEAFGEWPYFVSIFGDPGGDEPWGWQFDGHHLCINAVVVDGQLVMTPTFMGAEPRRVCHGRMAGTSLFDPEQEYGLDLIRSLDVSQRQRAIIYPSIHPDEISPHLQNLFDGRMQGGAFHDNLIAPYQGVAGVDMTDAQRRVLVALAGTYVGWSPDAHVPVRMAEVESHLDETWFSWYGGFDDDAPFYYRVHSPVILIEFDHHPGVALNNDVPSRHHVHTLMRTPNGGDYGADLLAQHHERFDHSDGSHRDRQTGLADT
jgi:fructose-1,6-bisphosphatase/inositol monophosphatase family enzyme